MLTYVRTRRLPSVVGERFNAPANGPSCPACGCPITAGQVCVFVVLGPGDSTTARQHFRDGLWYTAAAAVCHADCAGVPAQ